jgi:uncharacterized lipoprotein YmbA
MNAYYRRLAFAWLVSIGTACTSAPIRYYTLTPAPDPALRAARTAAPIDVRVVHIPPQLDHSELIVRTGPAETTLLDNERWASPMKDEIKEAVRLELQRRLGEMTGLPSFTLDIDVQRLEAQLGRYALLEASWRASVSGDAQRPGGARATSCAFRAEEEIRGGYAGMVEGYQREIAALADAIFAVLASSARDNDAACRSSIGGAAGIHR